MADILNISQVEIFASFWKYAPPEILDKINTILNIGKILSILILVYFIIVIIGRLFKLRDSFNISKIAKNVEEINEHIRFSARSRKKSGNQKNDAPPHLKKRGL